MRAMTQYSVYILASGRNGTLYVGMTNNMVRRLNEHKQNLVKGFTKQYSVHKLVYIETTNDVRAAIEREKQLKHWNRVWKLALIEKDNPDWLDLAENW